MTATALIIDDEPDILELLAMTLTRMGLRYHAAANLEDAKQLLNNYKFDVCLTDMHLPDGDGVEFVRYLQTKAPNLPVAVITAHGNMEAAVDAMKNGAYDFVSKPVNVQQLRALVVQAIALNNGDTNQQASNDAQVDIPKPQAQPEPKTFNVSLSALSHRDTATPSTTPDTSYKLVGSSAAMQTLRALITKVSRTNAPVWITGEAGTGKELTAKLIHESSPRANQAFVSINCGAIPSDQIESELFGHIKGSFAGATKNRQGLVQQANGGTLYIDEVAELPLHMQVKLLRAIQERRFRPIGGSDEITFDARIICASHKDLAAQVEAGLFRHDLYYRLNVIKLHSPSLSARTEDIPELCQSILMTHAKTAEGGNTIGITPKALEALANYQYPGNVLELENLLERTVALVDSNTIDVDDLDLPAQQSTDSVKNQPPTSSNFSTSETLRIVAALDGARWNRKQAAKQLGLTYRQLRYRIQQLGIDKND